ncbi:MAG: hypothetical protein N3H30_02400, partial [Candidatus Micrarchaeota archaeon]|nr:hypothetical protein [Candidatus Micrarchaeota archaeon]
HGENPAAFIVCSDGKVMGCALDIRTEDPIYNCSSTNIEDPTSKVIYAEQDKKKSTFLLLGNQGNYVRVIIPHKHLTKPIKKEKGEGKEKEQEEKKPSQNKRKDKKAKKNNTTDKKE